MMVITIRMKCPTGGTGSGVPNIQKMAGNDRKLTPGNQNDAASQPRGFYLGFAHPWIEDSASYAVQLVTLNTVHCAECYGGSNLDIQIHASFAHAGLAATDRRDRRGP
ncbi:hypothetical protein, partial [Bosea sp. (in: a-proteobacteria)]|uniref:hypothetical protein n=1 Tax=Bosea sp. (in: a-proteobacteria) TaxID=1871050 RepID=UPI0040335429